MIGPSLFGSDRGDGLARITTTAGAEFCRTELRRRWTVTGGCSGLTETTASTVSALLLAVLISGCGASSHDQSSSPSRGRAPEGAAETMAIRAVTADKPGDCERLATRRFIRAMHPGVPLKTAIRFCDVTTTAPNDAATSASVLEAQSRARRASVVVDVQGGAADGQELTVRLVKRHRQWKVDEVTGLEPPPAAIAHAEVEIEHSLAALGEGSAVVACARERGAELVAKSDISALRGGGVYQRRIDDVYTDCQTEAP